MFTFAFWRLPLTLQIVRIRLLLTAIVIPICFAGSASNALAQNQHRKPLPTEPLEEYDQPPVEHPVTGLSPGMILVYDGFTSQQVNVNANGMNITGDAGNEPSITVDPTNHNKMAIGWRQFDSVSSNFRQAGNAYTSNGGMNWISRPVLEPGVFRSDPVLYNDSTGTFFYLSLLETFFDNMWRSLDSGQTYTNLGPATATAIYLSAAPLAVPNRLSAFARPMLKTEPSLQHSIKPLLLIWAVSLRLVSS